MNEAIYRCSTGEYVSETQIWERFEDGSWTPYCWDDENGTEWVKTPSGRSLKLVPVASGMLPVGTSVVSRGQGVAVEAKLPSRR
ncbi:hypothetical protein [Halomarina oriensis]|uniref:Uncharacterized protein n=1 Tax=Halomarina oriensis TaxID=671145 RepID=A0A6B0GX12_9EURY|nr:hypothetical protein [Halomarina oriensis]MWG36298.1 hypothetical protein [Halomarina oriensis]